ncbi:ABC transporter permease subunit [Gemmobacter sp. 24YEA27]|uniref:ABC transporter permease n=1 Tax=Gemmobacter sp. 24YEA27 TaxID=3040672 RepID=UPI0024B3850F|nr:ABC transporter permease subunit [Gemmobacter sp. 24YEA27]
MDSKWELLGWGDAGWGDQLLHGFMMTIVVSVIAYALSLTIGLLAALSKLSASRILRGIANTYTTIVRSLPELLVILIVYFSLVGGAEKLLKSLGLVSDRFEFSGFWAAVVALAFVNGAFMTEVMRAGILAVPKGQTEAAEAIGMPRALLFRRIVLPQMLRHSVPGLGNLWLAITKESAVVAVLGTFNELLFTAYRAAGVTKEYGLFYSVVAAAFLLISLVSMAIIHRIEKRVGRGF